MYITLVPYVKNNLIRGHTENTMQRKCQFNRTQIGCKMTTIG